MKKQLLAAIMLSAPVFLAYSQSQIPSSALHPGAARVVAEPRRVDFERLLTVRFVVQGNEVYDRKTDLTWQRCNYGQTWDEENRWCKGVTKRLTITQATAEVAREQNSWRIPDIGEVMSLLEVACGNTKVADAPAPVFPEILPNTHYLSSSIGEDQKNVNAAQCFGSAANNAGLGKAYVSVLRLVRNGR